MLDRKVLRDLWNLRGQVVTIALLVAAGVTVLVGSVSAYVSLVTTAENYYRMNRFAVLWADVKRAPRNLAGRISEIPGVGIVEARVVKEVRVDWPQSETAVSGRMISLPDAGQSELNGLTISIGRSVDPAQRDEAVINAAFAESWNVRPGDAIDVVLNGHAQKFRIVGIANSPEFVYAATPGKPLPDDRTFVVMWVAERAVAAAFNMEGAFNSLTLSLAPEAMEAQVIAEIDRILAPYGAVGAFGRRDQPSHRFLSDELAEQRTLALTAPLIFFSIGAFLLNIVLTRLIEAQREQIAALKALGFPSVPIAMHYAKFVGTIALAGSLAGVFMGIRYGQGMVANYRPFFRFPDLVYVVPTWLPVLATLASLASALSGAALAVRRVLRLTPAEGMRPETPAGVAFRFADEPILRRWGPRTKMVWRAILGRPVKSALTVLGLALALPMVVMGLFWWDALAYMVDVQFRFVERADGTVTIDEPVSDRAVREIAHLSGVWAAEGLRVVPVRLSAGHLNYRMTLTGLDADAVLRAPRDERLRVHAAPPEGLLLTRGLADRLHVARGSVVVVECLEGRRDVFQLPVAAIVDEALGYNAYVEIGALNRLLHEGRVVNQVVMSVDPTQSNSIWRRLAERPHVMTTSVKSAWLRIFDEKIGGLVVLAAVVLTAFGVIISVAIVYNSARIALQERAWELASLCILGFTRGEVSRILLAELGVQIATSIPLGLVLSQYIVTVILAARSNESFSIPPVISNATFASATLIVFGAGAASALLVWRRIDRLDLTTVLKTRE